MHLRIVLGYRFCYLLKKGSLTRLWLGYYHTSLSLAYRCNKVYHTHRYHIVIRSFKADSSVREDRHKILELRALK